MKAGAGEGWRSKYRSIHADEMWGKVWRNEQKKRNPFFPSDRWEGEREERGRTTKTAENKDTEEMYSAHPDVLLILQLLSGGCGISALTRRQKLV